MFDVVEALYYLIPAAVLFGFFVSLIRYLHAGRKNRRFPGTYSAQQMRVRRIWLLLTGIAAGVLLAVVAAFALLLAIAIAYM